MDTSEFKRQLDAARAFTVEHDSAPGVVLRLRVPVERQLRAAAAQGAAGTGAASISLLVAGMQPHLVRDCLVGWDGITRQHFDPAWPAEAVAFDADLIDHVMDRWPALYDHAFAELQRRYNARRELRDTEVKN